MECQRCPLKPVLDAFYRSNNLAAFTSSSPSRPSPSRLRPFALAIEEALRNFCLKCTSISDDDNPTNRGQTMVSLDASIQDSDASVSDFLISHRIDNINASHGHSSGSVTSLPPDVEDSLRQQIASFASLSFMDVCLVAHLINGGSLASFATMNWIPSLPIDPHTGRPSHISRQAVHSRFKAIVRKVPTLAAISASVRRSVPSADSAPSTPVPPPASKRRGLRKPVARVNPSQTDFLGVLVGL